MRISIIIPCFKAGETLSRAVASIGAQIGYAAMHDVEVVLAADDGGDYTIEADYEFAITHIPPVQGQYGTGPGPTRNRGIAAARGQVIAFLDADDEWAPNYLAEMVPLVRRHGAAFAPTTIYNHKGQDIVMLGQGLRWITPSAFGRWPGSFHPMLDRSLTTGFRDGAGQDVFHAIDVLGMLGGMAPFADKTSYHLHLKRGSVTADPSFSRGIDQRYRAMIRHYQSSDTVLHGMARRYALQAIHRRMWWNAAWMKAQSAEDGFYGFFAQSRDL